MTRILIADDHNIVIDGIKLMLQASDEITCVGEAANGLEVLHKLETIDVDVVLLDINMPELNGIDTCERILKKYPDVKVIALSMYSEMSYIEKMIKNGASGYLLKNSSLDELVDAITRVMKGEQYYSKEVLDSMIDHLKGVKNSSKGADRLFPKISKREKQILKLIMDEYTSQEIADELHISFWTVETHRRNLMQKLDARNTAGLVRTTMEYQLHE